LKGPKIEKTMNSKKIRKFKKWTLRIDSSSAAAELMQQIKERDEKNNQLKKEQLPKTLYF